MAGPGLAFDRLQHLYEISKVLTEFQGIDKTIPEVLAIANDTVPLASAVLITDIEGREHVLGWRAGNAGASIRQEIVAHARTCFAYFAGTGPAGTLDHGASMPAVAEEITRAPLIALPLVVDHQRIFGVLQLEPTSSDESALSFGSAVTNQIAVAIDRHIAWQRNTAARKQAESERARAEAAEERQRAVAGALRESEERLRLALEATSVGTWDYDPATRVSKCDAACHALLGLPRDATVDMDVLTAAVHPEDRAEVLAAVARALDPASGGEYRIEHRIIGLVDGVERWAQVAGRAHFAAGRAVRFLGTALDVTERKRAEEAIRLSEAKLAGIVSLAADAILAIDEARRITLFNEAAEAIFGYRRDEVLGEPLERLLPDRVRAAHAPQIEAFAGDAETARWMGDRRSVFGRRKNGEEFPAEAAISRSRAGGSWTFTVVLRDITEQRRAEDAQRFLADAGAILVGSMEREETLATVAELAVRSLADCCIVDTLEEGREEMLRLTVAHADPAQRGLVDAIARVRIDRMRPHAARDVLESRRAVLVADVSPKYLTEIAQDEAHLRLMEELRPRSVMAVPLVARSRLLGAMVFVSSRPGRRYDAADLRTAEELSRMAALALDNARLYRTAQRAIEARDRVLAVVAHDLRDPLHTIAMSARMLPAPARTDEADAVGKAADRISRSAERMDRLIEDLLDVTRIDAGKLTVQPARQPPAQLVAEAVEAARTATSAGSLSLASAVEEGLPDVLADRDRILQVFSNLIGNAVKFTSPGGQVTVGAARAGTDVRFWVADTGAGIPGDEIQHVFDRFWQASARDRRGAGLGLSICKGIVEAHGGTLRVVSEPGRGSEFGFSLRGAP